MGYQYGPFKLRTGTRQDAEVEKLRRQLRASSSGSAPRGQGSSSSDTRTSSSAPGAGARSLVEAVEAMRSREAARRIKALHFPFLR